MKCYKKDLVAISRIIREAGMKDEKARKQLALEFSAFLMPDNANFDPDKFFEACGVS